MVPLHFVATYQDARGTHRLEEWRVGQTHLRRRTDNHIDLHADAVTKPLAGQAADYVWQILDLDKKIDHRISSQSMLMVGMMYSYWSMAHVLTRPAGRFTVTRLAALPEAHFAGTTCKWFEIAPDAQPVQRVCWSGENAIPLETQVQQKDGSYKTNFTVETLDHRPLPQAVFAVNAQGFQVRNVDELANED